MNGNIIVLDSKSIKVSVNKTPEGAIKAFQLMGCFIAIMVKYIRDHYKDFNHTKMFQNFKLNNSIINENAERLRKKIRSGEIELKKPEYLMDKEYIKFYNKIECAITLSAAQIAEDYFRSLHSYNGSKKSGQKPVLPDYENCMNIKVTRIKSESLLSNECFNFPIFETSEVKYERISLNNDDSDDIKTRKDIFFTESYINYDGKNIYVEFTYKKYILKSHNYSLRNIKTMGVDLGEINDATCTVYDNSTGKIVTKQIHIEGKEEIRNLINAYKSTTDQKAKNKLAEEINNKKIEYSKRLASEICKYATEQEVEIIFLEKLDNKEDFIESTWFPK